MQAVIKTISISRGLALGWLALVFACSAWAGKALDADAGRIQLALTNEPPSLNSLQATDEISMFVLMHSQEGLLNYGEDDQLVAGVAERWHLDAQQAEFHLRHDAKWCDGSPVIAADFIYAWQRALDPATATPYAFLLYPIKNARAINQGLLPPTALAVSSEHPLHLRVELAQPTAYFLSLTTFPVFYPLQAAFYQPRAARYGASVSDLLCNGAFRVSEWVQGARLRLRANPHYWNREQVSLREIEVKHITNDSSTLFNLYRAGEIAYTEINRDTLDQALLQRLPIHRFNRGSLSYLEFNLRPQRATASLELRQAISRVLDRQTLVNAIIAAPGTRPAERFFPSWLKNLQQAPVIGTYAPSPPAAPLLPVGKKLTLLIYDSPPVLRQAEYLQRQLAEQLGIELVIDRQIFKQKLAKLKSGDFDIAISAWGPDFDDPMTFAELLTSGNPNNHGAFSDADYDAAIARAAGMLAGVERDRAFIDAHSVLAARLPVLPLSEPGMLYLQHPALQQVRRSRFGGDPDFRHARIAEAP